MSKEVKLNPEPKEYINLSPGERPFLDKLRSGLGWTALGLIVAGGTLGLMGMGWPALTFQSLELFSIGDTVLKIGVVIGVAYIAITHATPAIMRITQGHIHRHP